MAALRNHHAEETAKMVEFGEVEGALEPLKDQSRRGS